MAPSSCSLFSLLKTPKPCHGHITIYSHHLSLYWPCPPPPPPQGPSNDVTPMDKPPPSNWMDEMDIAEPISPTPPTPIPSLSPKLAALTPPEPVEDHPFLFQRGPSQPSLYTSNSSDPDAMRKRKKTRNDGISNLQWLQLLSKLNHTNDNPLGWIEAISAIT